MVRETKLPPGPGGVPGAGKSQNTGGMQLGKAFRFVSDEEMPRLDADRIAEACDNIVSGRDCYKSLLYLSRARSVDISCLFEASRSDDVQRRWQRLWVLCPILARLARVNESRTTIVQEAVGDLAALHMFSKFDLKTNKSAERFFGRMREGLLEAVLGVLVEHRRDRARANLLIGIVAVIETDSETLRTALRKGHPEAIEQEVMPTLFCEETAPEGTGNVSATGIRDRLTDLGQKSPSE